MNLEKYTLQGRDWQGQNPAGWLMSEKLRGARAEWDGAGLWSKTGAKIKAPAWFTAGLPAGVRLSGEIYAGRCRIETAARLAVQYGKFARGVHSFRVFDAPGAPGNVAQRVAHAAALLQDAPHSAPISFERCNGLEHLIDTLRGLLDAGGEGLMLHHPTAQWTAGRTSDLLKVTSLSFALCQAAIA